MPRPRPLPPLPHDCIAEIVSHVGDAATLTSCARVNRTWLAATRERSVWRRALIAAGEYPTPHRQALDMLAHSAHSGLDFAALHMHRRVLLDRFVPAVGAALTQAPAVVVDGVRRRSYFDRVLRWLMASSAIWALAAFAMFFRLSGGPGDATPIFVEHALMTAGTVPAIAAAVQFVRRASWAFPNLDRAPDLYRELLLRMSEGADRATLARLTSVRAVSARLCEQATARAWQCLAIAIATAKSVSLAISVLRPDGAVTRALAALPFVLLFAGVSLRMLRRCSTVPPVLVTMMICMIGALMQFTLYCVLTLGHAAVGNDRDSTCRSWTFAPLHIALIAALFPMMQSLLVFAIFLLSVLPQVSLGHAGYALYHPGAVSWYVRLALVVPWLAVVGGVVLLYRVLSVRIRTTRDATWWTDGVPAEWFDGYLQPTPQYAELLTLPLYWRHLNRAQCAELNRVVPLMRVGLCRDLVTLCQAVALRSVERFEPCQCAACTQST